MRISAWMTRLAVCTVAVGCYRRRRTCTWSAACLCGPGAERQVDQKTWRWRVGHRTVRALTIGIARQWSGVRLRVDGPHQLVYLRQRPERRGKRVAEFFGPACPIWRRWLTGDSAMSVISCHRPGVARQEHGIPQHRGWLDAWPMTSR
jgi:hypothetical protein